MAGAGEPHVGFLLLRRFAHPMTLRCGAQVWSMHGGRAVATNEAGSAAKHKAKWTAHLIYLGLLCAVQVMLLTTDTVEQQREESEELELVVELQRQ
jgi:cyanate permease